MEIGFDVISDLYLGPDDSFNWENKATSLYCIVAGNVSSDIRTLRQTLLHLSGFYQGIFYIMGSLEYQGYQDNLDSRTLEILETVALIPNTASLFHHVVIVDGIAILGCNGWGIPNDENPDLLDIKIRSARVDDLGYMYRSVAKLQTHLDVKRIMMVSNAVPRKELYFGEHPKFYDAFTPLDYCVKADTENKIAKWIFGTYEKSVDTVIDSVHYINNPFLKKRPYWAKRITLRC